MGWSDHNGSASFGKGKSLEEAIILGVWVDKSSLFYLGEGKSNGRDIGHRMDRLRSIRSCFLDPLIHLIQEEVSRQFLPRWASLKAHQQVQ